MCGVVWCGGCGVVWCGVGGLCGVCVCGVLWFGWLVWFVHPTSRLFLYFGVFDSVFVDILGQILGRCLWKNLCPSMGTLRCPINRGLVWS